VLKAAFRRAFDATEERARDYAAGQPELVVFYDSAMEIWRSEMLLPAPQHTERRTAVRDDFLDGLRGRALTS
jgi:hypothetical protein